MNLATTVSIYAGGPGSGCNPEKGKCGRPKSSAKSSQEFVVSGEWNPEADLVYHWTRNIEGILDSEKWEGGSVTHNPAYEFAKGEQYPYRIALVFDPSRMELKPAPKTVPWEEWESLSDDDVDLSPIDVVDVSPRDESSAFLGFAVRSKRDESYLRARMRDRYDVPDMFPVHRLDRVKPRRLHK